MTTPPEQGTSPRVNAQSPELDHPGWDRLEEALDEFPEPECETAGDPFHRHTAHCFGMDDPIRGEL